MKVLLICLLYILSYTHAFHLQVMTQYQFNKQRTQYKELLPSQSPTFKVSSRGKVVGIIDSAKGFHGDYKISFSFQDGQFKTPWILVSNPKEKIYLKQIEFTFTHSGDSLRTVQTKPIYSNELNEVDVKYRGPRIIDCMYHWYEIESHDTESGLLFVYVGSFVACISLLLVRMFKSLEDGSITINSPKTNL